MLGGTLIKRRSFLQLLAGTTLISTGPAGVSVIGEALNDSKIRNRLNSIRPTRERIWEFTERFSPEEAMAKSNGWTYDSELGWVHCSAYHDNGVDGSQTFYHYESDGARRVINCRGQSSRIHAFGNSFTHCDQVNDNETWEEYLAAHLQEPIRNYGVGGYSVYQAYRRMLKVEEREPADYIILNIYSDDHFRNLDAWRSIRVGAGSSCSFTLPHLRVNVGKGWCEQAENLLDRAEDVARLRNEDFIFRSFRDDPVLHYVLGSEAGDALTSSELESIAGKFGVSPESLSGSTSSNKLTWLHTQAALFATKNVVEWTEQFIERIGSKLMLVLSFSRSKMAASLRGESQFDQSFVEWLADKPYPVADMREAFSRNYENFSGGVDQFLEQYYMGHHKPAGNFLAAWALKDSMVNWLEPKPLPYRMG
jgi:hypothetical protein